MAQVEKDVGRRLEWAVVNHRDTDHPHADVVARGVDREARPYGSIARTSPMGFAGAPGSLRPASAGPAPNAR